MSLINAQLIKNNDYPTFPIDKVQMLDLSKNSFNTYRDIRSAWYAPYAAYVNSVNGENFSPTITLVAQDSNLVTISPDQGGLKSIKNMWAHSVGDMMDPLDLNYSFTDAEPLSKFTSYTIDSIFFRYAYIRNVDSIMNGGSMRKMIDTVVLQIYDATVSIFDTAVFKGGDRVVYGSPAGQDHLTGLGLNAIKTIKIPLDEKDSTIMAKTGWKNKLMYLPIDINFRPPGRLSKGSSSIAYTLTFKSDKHAPLGDTAFNVYDSSFLTAHVGITNKHNYFGVVRYQNNGYRILREDTYNNAFTSTKDVRYGQTTPDSFQNYIPNLSQWGFMGFMGFKLTFPVSINEINKNGYGLGQAYPNPIHSGDIINVNFELGHATIAVVSLMNINGRVIETIQVNGTQGINTAKLSTANLATGIYLYSLTAKNFTATKKFMVQ